MRRTFRAMGTEVALISHPDADADVFDGAFARVASIFAREERRFSRFRDNSELSRLNRSTGRWFEVSAPFATVLRLGLDGASATAGSFDPTVLRAVEAAGYDRDFRAIVPGDVSQTPAPTPCGRWREIELDDGRVRLPHGVGLDLGGLVKGWTADLAAETAVRLGLPWAIVNAGGDLRLAGDAPPLDVGIEEPHDRTATCCVVRIEAGGVATTSVTLRSWGQGLHHVIDPRTGLSARTPLVQATMWAPTCAEAEILAKWALLEGVSALDRLDGVGVLVLASGEIVTNLTGAAA